MNRTDKPLAAPGLTSYRYRYGPHGCHYVMIGANSESEALTEAYRSLGTSYNRVSIDNLEVWNGERYEAIKCA